MSANSSIEAEMSDRTIGKTGEQPAVKKRPFQRRLGRAGDANESMAQRHSDRMTVVGITHTGKHTAGKHTGGHQQKKDRNRKGRK